MDQHDSPRFERSFSPAYAAKVEISGSLSPKFEKEIIVSKPATELKLSGDGPPHADMHRRFSVLSGGAEGVNFNKPVAGGVPKGAQLLKMRGLEDPKDPKAVPPSKAPEVLEEVVLVPKQNTEISDSKVLERIERMMRAEQRSRDLEEENRALTRTIARLQAENDALKAKG